MKTLILAGGYGTRLKEIGEKLPKGLITYKNTPIIQHILQELRSNGLEDFTVVTNNKYFPQFDSWCKNIPFQVKLLNDGSNSPENRLGALGDLLFAIQELKWEKEHILVAPSDTLITSSLTPFLKMVGEKPEEFATIVRIMKKEEMASRLGCAVLSPDGYINEFFEKPAEPPSPCGAVPFYYYPRSIHTLLNEYKSEGNSLDAPGNIIPWLLKRQVPVRASIMNAQTIDIGTPAELKLLEKL